MLQSTKIKCLVLSSYPHSDPQQLLYIFIFSWFYFIILLFIALVLIPLHFEWNLAK